MIKTEIISLTPSLAREFLEKNTKNRPLQEAHVQSYKGAILRGEWKINGDPIRFSKTGKMLDGQHRCHAVIRAGVSITVAICSGLDDDVFDTIDRGAVRTTADILGIKGEKNYALLAAVARLVYVHNLNPNNPFSIASDQYPTAQQLCVIVDSNPSLRNSVHFVACHAWLKKYCAPSVVGFCHFIFSKTDKKKCEDFFVSLDSGADLQKFSPIFALRERLIYCSLSKGKLKNFYKTALIFKAFKLYRDDAFVKTLRVRTEGEIVDKDLFVL